MSLLREILAESFLLREDASVDAINNAVNNMHPVRIVYYGPSGTGTGEREIYPVAYGVSTAGNPVVRAFQPQGSTSTEVPAWKFFRLDRIKKWENDNSRTFNPEELNGFNDKGDEQIETLYAISPIGNAKPEKEPQPEKPEKILTAHPVSKGEVDNGGADKNTEREYYTANDAVHDILRTASPKMGSPNDLELQKNIDKLPGLADTEVNGQDVRDPVPVTKSEVDPNFKPTDNAGAEANPQNNANNGPITKSDLNPTKAEGPGLNNVDTEETEEEDLEKNTLTESFKSLMARMNNLYKD